MPFSEKVENLENLMHIECQIQNIYGCRPVKFNQSTRCLKITEKVSFNIASEAGYVYILSGQKLSKNAQNGPFWQIFENVKFAVIQCYQTGHF